MRHYFLALTFLCCQLLAFNAYAGQNPIAWSVSPNTGFPAQTNVGSSYAVTYTLSNNMPFASPLRVTSAYNGGTFAITNGCNRTLAAKGQPNSSCLIHISFQPIAPRVNNITLTLAYGNNRVPLPTLSSTSISGETGDKISGHVYPRLPAVTYIGSSYPVGFTFVNNGKTSVTATAVNVSGFTATTNTCTSPLVPNVPCAVTGTFTPATVGFKTLSVTYVYSGGSVPLITTTNVQNGGGGCHHVDAQATLPLPANTFIYADNVVKYTFTNYCPTTETLSAVSFNPDASATLTKGQDTCSNATLAANGGTCFVYVSVVPTATNPDLSVTAEASYNGSVIPASATTSAVVSAIPTPSTKHTVYLVNQCDENVWYEFANNSGTGQSDPTPAGQRKYTDYQMPAQLPGAAPSTKTLTFSAYTNGGIYGRTKCDPSLGYCLTANCTINSAAGDDWSCQQGVGALTPATAIEEYMPDATGADGVYDVSVINGFNVPAEMKSLALINPSNNVFTQACGQATGAVIQPTGSILGNATWAFDPSTSGDSAANYIWVSAGADDACTTGSCGVNEYCGTAFNSLSATYGAGTPPINRRCGTFQGYWQVQAYNAYPTSTPGSWGSVDLYAYYQLGDLLGVGPTGVSYGTISSQAAKVYDLYACPIVTSNGSLNTGYGANHINACGCEQWSFTGSASNCQSFNSQWSARVLPRFSWLKTAAPTVYTFQYDDPSSSFTCQISGQKTSYQVTYCPAGKSGKPGGV
jgi:hypothetical protein